MLSSVYNKRLRVCVLVSAGILPALSIDESCVISHVFSVYFDDITDVIYSVL